MRVFPSNKQEWFTAALIPFQVYVVVAPTWLFLWKKGAPDFRGHILFEEEAGVVFYGYAYCLLAFILAAIIQSIAGWRRARFVSVVWGSVAFAVMLVFAFDFLRYSR